MVLAHSNWYKLIALWIYLILLCYTSAGQKDDSTTIDLSQVKDNPDFWLKNTHSTTCDKHTVRTFLINTKEGDPLSLVIRQNVRGKVVVQELPTKGTSGHEVQVAINWTASSSEVLSGLHNEYKIKDGSDEKIVLLEIDIGDLKQKKELSPFVVGGTVAGFFVLLGFVILGLYMARRNPKEDPVDETSQSPTDEKSGFTPDSQNSSNKVYAERHFNMSRDDDGEADDDGESLYHRPNHRAASSQHGGDETSLNLSVLPDMTHETSAFPSAASTLRPNGMPRHVAAERQSLTEFPPPLSVIGQPELRLLPPPRLLNQSSESGLTDASSDTLADPKVPRSMAVYNIPPINTNAYSSTPTSSSPTSPRNDVYAVPDKSGNRKPPSTNVLNHSADEDTSNISDTDKPPRPGGGNSGGYFGSNMLGRTVMVVAVLSIATQAALSLCHDDVSVEILIYIPKQAKINSIDLYANQLKPTVFERTAWFQSNQHKFKTFDLATAKPTEGERCTPKLICPTASDQSALGCDWETQKCVCVRGWYLNARQTCEDIDECVQNKCPPDMDCINLPGSFDCTCRSGAFWNGTSCQACSTGCGAGSYQSGECTAWDDRKCSPCTVCKDGSFTYKPCTAMLDSQCMDVSQPYVQYDNAPSIKPQQVELTSQSNMFVEELHNNRNLRYPLYISDNNQVVNFQWTRDSGIRVFVKADNFHIIPEFTDVVHQNDNQFVQQLLPNQRSYINRIIYNYCRSPIPDYYTLIMHKYRERTTQLTSVVCNTTMRNCPPRFSDGQSYKFRTFNTKCPKTSPDYDTTIEINPLQDSGNSVVCNEKTPILTDIFNDTLSKDRPLSFRSLDCNQAIWKCKECFSVNKCGEYGNNESCCAVGCHAQRICKQAFGQECFDAEEECATGDTAQYIIQPVFEDLSSEFLCHIRRTVPESVFTLGYEIAIPTAHGWNSTRKTISLPTSGESTATQSWDFFNVTYNNYLNTAQDDMLLQGKRLMADQDFTKFDILNFKERSEFNRTKIRPVKYETITNKDTWTADVQNERPFDVSSWNFHSTHGCYMDVRKIHGKQPMYKESSRHSVELNMMKTGGTITYKVRAVDQTPKADFFLAGDQSVMSYYFPDSKLKLDSITVDLHDVQDYFYRYSIEISGMMAECDSYLGVSIYDKTTQRSVAKYDSFVYCTPDNGNIPSFKFAVKLPESGSKNKLFAVTLKDSDSTITYYVTTYSHTTSLIQNNSIAIDLPAESSNFEPNAYYGMEACFAIFSIIFLIVYISIQYGVVQVGRIKSNEECSYKNTRRNCMVILYLVFKLVYSGLFSITALFLLIQWSTNSNRHVLSELPSYHMDIRSTVERNIRAITEFKQVELNRHYDMGTERIRACGDYSVNTIDAIKDYTDKMTGIIMEAKNEVAAKKFALLATHMDDYSTTLRSHVDKHEADVASHLEEIFEEYEQQLQEVISNGWLTMPHENFKAIKNNRTIPVGEQKYLTSETVQFMTYLGVEKPSSAIYQAQLLTRQLKLFKDLIKLSTNQTLQQMVPDSLDKPELSKFMMRSNSEPMAFSAAEFALGSTSVLKFPGLKFLLWIAIIICDTFLFLYRMAGMSRVIHRIKIGYADEQSDEPFEEPTVEMELSIIRKQIVGEGEMSESLLQEEEGQDKEEVPFKVAGKASSKAGSRAGSRQGSRAPSEVGSRNAQSLNYGVSDNESETAAFKSVYKRSAVSEGGSVRGSMRHLGRHAAVTESDDYYTLPASAHRTAKLTKQQSVQSSSLSRDQHPTDTHSVPPSEAPSHRAENFRPETIGEVTEDAEEPKQEEVPTSGDNTQNASYCMTSRGARLAVSSYAIPFFLWLTSQVIAIVIVVLLTELITYNTITQVMNINSMLMHIGMYVSSVNNYITTHAKSISQLAQDSMVQEYNLHIHHISKIRTLLEYDLNWSIENYSNQKCVLNGMLVEHCAYQPIRFASSLTPCQSFPIEPFQYEDRSGLNTKLISQRVAEFTDALRTLIITSVGIICFYINSIIIIHIISLVLYSLLKRKKFIHVLACNTRRSIIPVTSKSVKLKQKEEKATQEDDVRTSMISSHADLSSEVISNTSRHSIRSQHSLSQTHFDDDASDPLLSKIRAQISVAEQSGDESANHPRTVSSVDRSLASESEM